MQTPSCSRRRSPGAVVVACFLLGTMGPACQGEDDRTTGYTDPCSLPKAPPLGCPPPGASPARFDAAAACRKYLSCGSIFLERTNERGDHDTDFTVCMRELGRLPPERAEGVFLCVEGSTCAELGAFWQSPCLDFGDQK